MDIKTALDLPKNLPQGCICVGVYENSALTPSAKIIDKATGGLLQKTLKQGDISGKKLETLILRNVPGINAERILLVGLGSEGVCNERHYREILQKTMQTVRGTATKTLFNTLTEVRVGDRDANWKGYQTAIAAVDSGYKVDKTHAGTVGRDAKSTQAKFNKLIIQTDKASQKAVDTGAKEGIAVANGNSIAKDLGNLAPNVCTPEYLAGLARKMGKTSAQLSVSILEEKQMEKLGMGAFLSVSRGSRLPAKLIVMNYKGAKKAAEKPIVLIGKGITFDTGGISIKPSAGMDEMKFDMCGAASVFGVMQSILDLKPTKNIICVVAAAENMPDGDASRPGDVVKTMSGQTVEILNTDAEGRLVLCDTLTYVERFKPSAVIDVATLTGACIVALGHVGSALMSNNDQLAEELLQASNDSGDKTWQLPLWDEYQDQLQSNFADMGNIGGAPAGSITAGCFLSRFAKQFAWAHLDIAGVAWQSGKSKGATGRPVPLLMRYILNNR